ncbi:MAG: sulfatase-like hydrolase/transferase [Chloroflexi bacterium]|nr:sulfatase-like hydrolase/transferase [Chloroflexota bacterium]
MSDQHNANCMGHAGRRVRTPNLDWLAAQGVRFSQAFCNNPICAPSRISFITGRYPHSHRHLGNSAFDYPERNPNTLSAVARRHGYQTALAGKAHMIRAWDEEGFEHIRYCDLCDADRDDPLTNHYFRYLYEHGLADKYDFGTLPPNHPGKGSLWFVSEIPHEHSIEVWTGNETLAFLRGRDRRRPFFVQMTFQRPHAPLSPSPERAHMYSPDEVDVPSSACDLFERGFATKPAFQRRHVTRHGGYPFVPADEAELRRHLTHYYALVSIIDEQIGRVLDYLREEGELENTVIVYVADHGDFAGDHGLMQKNFGIYESIHRIPFLLVYPGGPAGREAGELVESVDLYPTLCRLMDVPVPEGVEGRSLLPVVEEGAPGAEAVVCEWSRPSPSTMTHAVRTPEFRLVYYGRGAEGELYDRRDDPDELVNRWDDPAYAAVRLELTERLLDYVMHYEKRSDMASDRREDARSRNSMTRLLHKGMKRWPDLAPLYVPPRTKPQAETVPK